MKMKRTAIKFERIAGNLAYLGQFSYFLDMEHRSENDI